MKETNQPSSQIEPGKPGAAGGREARAAGAPWTAAGGPLASNLAGVKPPRARKPRKNAAKPRGRLDREILAKIGTGLKESFEDVRREEVPQRFKVLMQQL